MPLNSRENVWFAFVALNVVVGKEDSLNCHSNSGKGSQEFTVTIKMMKE
jgi:hypothetical protein